MNYEGMSDFEINKCVAEAVGMEISSDHSGAYVGVVRRSIGSKPNYLRVNYCNNPSDAWNIVMENHITIFSPDYNKGDSDWRAELYDSDEGIFDFTDKNPLRAAMIVFLMVRCEQE